jgi:hypothetical protein
VAWQKSPLCSPCRSCVAVSSFMRRPWHRDLTDSGVGREARTPGGQRPRDAHQRRDRGGHAGGGGGRVFDPAGDELELAMRGGQREGSASTFPMGILIPDEPYDEAPPGAIGERLVIVTTSGSASARRSWGTSPSERGRSWAPAPSSWPTSLGTPWWAGCPRGSSRAVRRRRRRTPPVGRVVGLAAGRRRGAHRWFTRPVAEFLDHFDPGSVASERRLTSARFPVKPERLTEEARNRDGSGPQRFTAGGG